MNARWLLPLLPLAGAAWCFADWRADHAAGARLSMEAAPSATLPPPHPWRARLGELAPAPPLADLQARWQEWAGIDLAEGSGLAAATEAGMAGRCELARWCAREPERALAWQRMSAIASADGRSCELRGDYFGPAQPATAMLEHLLAAGEGLGYLTDPVHLQLSREGNGRVHVFLRLLVTPAGRFFSAAEGG